MQLSSDSRCSRTSPMNVGIESSYGDCERILCDDWVWSKMCGKHTLTEQSHNPQSMTLGLT